MTPAITCVLKKKPRLLYPKTCYFSLSLLRRSLSDPLAERGFNRILPVAFDLEAHWLRTALCLRLDGLGFLFAQRRLLKRSGCRPVHHRSEEHTSELQSLRHL